ncbi:MAG: 50S ribosomal protein L21 [Chitinophagales bacterium]|nr:50S ribosomal protein L21 [Bacteroidota bacterium]MCB9043462.1 50S ribosomal protein L21 [Chitinophagales bacterium]
MFAIVEIGGQQFKVSSDQEIFVNRLAGKEGDAVKFDKVLLVGSDSNVQVGLPTTGGVINATIVAHVKGDKVLVFKKKRRKGYKVFNTHRQALTKIKIGGIA